MPDLTPLQIASAHAHQALAELIRLGATVLGENVGTARDAEAGLQVVVFVTSFEPLMVPGGLPMPRHPLPQSQPAARSRTVLRGIDQCALDAAPKPGAEPATIKTLARLAGYAYGSHFREAVRRLIDLGELVRVTGGVRRAK
jgi:hypothetical protein